MQPTRVWEHFSQSPHLLGMTSTCTHIFPRETPDSPTLRAFLKHVFSPLVSDRVTLYSLASTQRATLTKQRISIPCFSSAMNQNTEACCILNVESKRKEKTVN